MVDIGEENLRNERMMCVRKAIRLYSMRFYFDVVVMIDIYCGMIVNVGRVLGYFLWWQWR